MSLSWFYSNENHIIIICIYLVSKFRHSGEGMESSSLMEIEGLVDSRQVYLDFLFNVRYESRKSWVFSDDNPMPL